METRWSRNLVQRENIVADTGTGRVQKSSRTNAASRSLILEWTESEGTYIENHVRFGNELLSALMDLSFNKISTIEHSVFSTLLELRLTRNQLRSFPHNINILFPVLHSLSLTPNCAGSEPKQHFVDRQASCCPDADISFTGTEQADIIRSAEWLASALPPNLGPPNARFGDTGR
ncbi:hypothetical protein BLNAU_3257 [Blattamonas nauphoetae]|uniref:Uncharacterized protein n=1 Tax=Blattamonas nauphoetae TaxID=2049346 RepID=A0ABQ9YDQ7_9EUKA|nr:hypothetical protein BLNAU_3257 [Blattamonas nauphoetae]